MRRRYGSTVSLGARASHPHDDRPGQDRVGQSAEPGQRDGAVRGYLLGLDDLALDDAPAGDGAAAVPGVEQPADLLVVLRLRPEHGVDLVVQDRRRALGVRPCGTGTPA